MEFAGAVNHIISRSYERKVDFGNKVPKKQKRMQTQPLTWYAQNQVHDKNQAMASVYLGVNKYE